MNNNTVSTQEEEEEKETAASYSYEYEYYTSRFRDAISKRKVIDTELEDILNKMIDIKLQSNPGWSITKCLRIITNENKDLEFSFKSLYEHLNPYHRNMLHRKVFSHKGIKSTGKNIDSADSSSVIKIKPATTEREANELSGEMVRNKGNISKDDVPEHIACTQACLKRDVRKDEIIIGLKEQLKQTQQKLKRSEQENNQLKEEVKTLKEQLQQQVTIQK